MVPREVLGQIEGKPTSAMDDPTDEHLATTVAQLRQGIAELEASAAVLDSVLDCIITMDADGKVIEFNTASKRTFGYTKADAIGRALTDLIVPPLPRDAHAAGLARYLATGEGPLIGKLIEMTAIVGGRVVGVMALFARHALSDPVISAMASVPITLRWASNATEPPTRCGPPKSACGSRSSPRTW
jgi:PAS domain S-box-containing protein